MKKRRFRSAYPTSFAPRRSLLSCRTSPIAGVPGSRPPFIPASAKASFSASGSPIVDLPNWLLTVARSYDRDTTKGGHADVIPIATELVAYLDEAIARSPSGLVFPAPTAR